MSYIGIRKGSIIKNKEGYFCFKCDCYDSSITTYSGGRCWENNMLLYDNRQYKTRAELEDQLFIDFLNGDLHGAYGKFAPLNWNSCKVELTSEQKEHLRTLKERENKLFSEVAYSQNPEDKAKARLHYTEAHDLYEATRVMYYKEQLRLYNKSKSL